MNIKVRDLKQTETIENSNKLMVLVDDDLNLVKNITKEEFLTNVISKSENNALVQEPDGNLYVNTSEISDKIGDLNNLVTEDKTNLVTAINEVATNADITTEALNKQQISNCVLSAENGYMEFSGRTLTLKSGFRALIPNGRNTDGTLNNIEVYTTGDATCTGHIYANNLTRYAVFLDVYGQLNPDWSYDYYFIDDNAPTVFANGQAIWYDTFNNYMKVTYDSGQTWSGVALCYICDYEINPSDSMITALRPNMPIKIYTQNDLSLLSKLALPSEFGKVLTLGISGDEYIAPSNGWYLITKPTTTTGGYISATVFKQGLQVPLMVLSQAGFQSAYISFLIPISKGDKVRINYVDIDINSGYFSFIYANGEV